MGQKRFIYTIDWKKELPIIMFICFVVILSLILYRVLPERVPLHWGMNGEVDYYGSKASLFFIFLPLIVFLYLFLLYLPFISVTKYQDFPLTLYRIIRFVIIVFLSLLYCVTLAVALGYPVPVPFVVIFLIGILFVILGNFLDKVKQNYIIGFRLPWTLASEEVWTKTHQLGKSFMIGLGILSMIAAFFPPVVAFMVLIGGILATVIILTFYSYDLYKKEKAKDKK